METKGSQQLFEDSLISFSYDIYRGIESDVSTCVSPYSVISALLLLMAGTGGKSKSQIKSSILSDKWNDVDLYLRYEALNYKVFDVKEVELYFATKLFLKNGLTFTKNMRDVAEVTFDASVGYKDFSKPKVSAHYMNRFISKRTNGKIKNMISWQWLNNNTVMVLANAVYFKGTWSGKFDRKKTKQRDFFAKNNNKIKVSMMEKEDKVLFVNEEHFSAITLPYKGDQYDMVIVLPKDNAGLPNLKKTFSSDVARIIDKKSSYKDATINLPKFKFQADINLKDLLPKLGITDIFNGNVADFTNLVYEVKEAIYISEARHRVIIEVNEEGTEAAAATTLVATVKSTPVKFIADHPFMFYVRHRSSNSIFFMGDFNP